MKQQEHLTETINPATNVYKIQKKILLLVEGRTDYHFFEALFNTLMKKNQTSLFNQIQIVPVWGKANFKTTIKKLQSSPPQQNSLENSLGWDEVHSLALIRDANGDFKASFKSVCSSLQQCNLSCPEAPAHFTNSKQIKTGIYILPDNKSKGALEKLFLSAQKNDRRMECVDVFFKCVQQQANKHSHIALPKDEAKARARAYLASLEEDTAHISRAVANNLDLNAPALQPLIQFLEKLCTNNTT